MSDIPEIPELPIELKEAIEKDKLVIFTGAGVSTLLGCKRWADLGNELINKCEQLNLITFRELQGIKSRSDGKKLISIAFELMKDSFENEFYEIFDKALNRDTTKNETQDTYDLLFKISKTCVTTNADKLFDEKFNADNIISEFEKSPIKIESHKLYKIHGTQDKRNTLVFVAETYLKRYNNINFKNFLRDLFNEYTVLFLGYGLSEFELLDYIMLKPTMKSSIKKAKHYSLMPYFSYEESISKIDSLYYRELNIQTIPYAIDSKGYNQLYYVIKNWEQQITQKTLFIKNNMAELDEMLSNANITNSSISKVLEIIKKDDAYLKHFVSICYQNKELTNIFIEPLYNIGIFSPKKNPKPIRDRKNDGFFIPFWSILEFLEAYIQYVKSSNDYTKFKYFEKIINENTKEYNIDNDKTDSYIILFIFELPVEKIQKQHMDYIKASLLSRFGGLLASDALRKIDYKKVLSLPPDILRNFVELLIDVNIYDNYKMIPFVEMSFLKEIISLYFDALYKKIGKDFISIIINIINKLPVGSFIFVRFRANTREVPAISEENYSQTILNILIWHIQKQESPILELEKICGMLNEDLKTIIIEQIKNNVLLNKNVDEYTEEETFAQFQPVSSSYNFSDLEKLNANELIDIIYKDEKATIPLAGLDSDIHSLFIKYPEKYIGELELFLNIKMKYLYQIINAYTSLLNQNKQFNTQQILDFLDRLTTVRKDLWINKTNDRGFNYQLWLVQSIGNYLIEYLNHELLQNKEINFQIIKTITIKIYDNLSPEREDYSYSDYMSIFLNSESGIVVQLLIRLYLLNYQIFSKEDNEIRLILNKFVTEQKYLMIYSGLGFWFENINYYNHEFSMRILDDILNLNQQQFDAFCYCYLFNNKSANNINSYNCIKESGFIQRLLSQIGDKNYSGFGALVCKNYLRGYESLVQENSIIREIIESKDIFLITEIITFIFNSHEYLNDEQLLKSIEVWSFICSQLQDEKENSKYRELIIHLLDLISIINCVDDKITKNIRFSIIEIPAYRIEHIMFPKFLELYSDVLNRNNIQLIIREFCDKQVFFDNYNSNLTQLIKMISKDNKDFAIEICNLYIINRNRNYEELLEEISK